MSCGSYSCLVSRSSLSNSLEARAQRRKINDAHRGVDDVAQVLRPAAALRVAGRQVAKLPAAGAGVQPEHLHSGRLVRAHLVRQQQPGICLLQHVSGALRWQRRVERDVHPAGLEHRQQRDVQRRRLAHADADGRAGADAMRDQVVRQLVGSSIDLGNNVSRDIPQAEARSCVVSETMACSICTACARCAHYAVSCHRMFATPASLQKLESCIEEDL